MNLRPGQYTNPQVEEEILRLVRILEDSNDEMAMLVKKFADARVTYEAGKAKATTRIRARYAGMSRSDKPTVDAVEAMVAEEVTELHEASIYAEEILKAQHARIRSYIASISALQTLASNLRAEFNSAGLGR